MAGYSGTPLAKKLGIKVGCVLAVIGAPNDFRSQLEPLPESVKFSDQVSDAADIVHVFTTKRSELERFLVRLRSGPNPDVSVWVSWPKKSSKVATEINEDTIREVARPLGFIDIKVCAVTEVWSGLKLVIRKELR
jgi:hypothetical protein